MKITKHRFESGITYIHNDMVLSERHLFNIKDLDKVCRRHRFSDTVKQEVIDLYNSKEELSLEKVLRLDHAEIARFDYKELLDILIKDEDWYVRSLVAAHNYKDLLDILVKDKSVYVRAIVAKHEYKDLLDILVKDDNELVLEYVTMTMKSMGFNNVINKYL